jgi:hypothetical protein
VVTLAFFPHLIGCLCLILKGLLTEGFFWIPSLAGPTTIASRQNGSGISWLFPFVVSVLVSNLTTLLSFSRIYNNFFELYNICRSHIAIWFTSSITVNHSIITEYNFSSDVCFSCLSASDLLCAVNYDCCSILFQVDTSGSCLH